MKVEGTVIQSILVRGASGIDARDVHGLGLAGSVGIVLNQVGKSLFFLQRSSY